MCDWRSKWLVFIVEWIGRRFCLLVGWYESMWGSTSSNQWFDEICLYVQGLAKHAKDPRCSYIVSYIVAWFWCVAWVWLWWHLNCREHFRCLALTSWIKPTWWTEPDRTAFRKCPEVIRSASLIFFWALHYLSCFGPSGSITKPKERRRRRNFSERPRKPPLQKSCESRRRNGNDAWQVLGDRHRPCAG